MFVAEYNNSERRAYAIIRPHGDIRVRAPCPLAKSFAIGAPSGVPAPASTSRRCAARKPCRKPENGFENNRGELRTVAAYT